MFTLHRLEVQNIRSIGHIVFEPLVDGGMTAVNGPNGAGKTSLLAAMVWAIYGVTPDGVQQQNLRRQGSTLEDEVRVQVDFTFDGQLFTVERGLKGVRDTPYLRVSIDGIQQAIGKIRVAEAFLVDRLRGLDADAFLTAFVIRQKEIDGLVKARPAERRRLIERLAGIDRMSTAVKAAREEETEVRKQLDLLPGSPEDLQSAIDYLENTQQAATQAWETRETAALAQQSAATTALDAAQALTAAVAAADAYNQASRKVSSAQATLAQAESSETSTRTLLHDCETASLGGTPEDLASARAALDDANNALRRLQELRGQRDAKQQTVDREHAHLTQCAARLTQASGNVDAAQQQLDSTTSRMAGAPHDLPHQIEQAQRQLAQAQETVGAARREYESLAASIKALSTTSEDACCPTCSSRLDDPAALLATLNQTMARVRQEGAAASKNAETLTQSVTSLQQQAAAVAQLGRDIEHAQQTLARATSDLTSAESDHTAASAAVATAENELAELTRATESTGAQEPALRTGWENTSARLRAVETACAAADKLPGLRDQHASAARDLTAAQAAHQEALTVFGSLSEPDLGGIERRNAAARDVARDADRGFADADREFQLTEAKVQEAERLRDIERAKMQARQDTLIRYETRTATREALDEFRKDRIASLAPELSEIATDSIAQMTDGQYVAVELDEEFTATLTDSSGARRPAAWLSGGEESAVALALRLAIGEVIAGQGGGILWMDEPQTAMDSQRRPAMMSVIRTLKSRQPIIISHVTEAADMVDLVLEVVPDHEHGSTLIRNDINETPVGDLLQVS